MRLGKTLWDEPLWDGVLFAGPRGGAAPAAGGWLRGAIGVAAAAFVGTAFVGTVDGPAVRSGIVKGLNGAVGPAGWAAGADAIRGAGLPAALGP
ncbi:MAG TPA: hypothetical protein VFE24_14145 [Pirellulales bacterium]|jgi:hypothetical protein|nr:hypothetical protein [Pirellulales bacterium]